MSEVKPILFSGPMVRAILEGRKSRTRRTMTLPTKGIYEHPKMGGWEATTVGGGGAFTIKRDGTRLPAPEMVAIWHKTCGTCIVTKYQPGDLLWVREGCAWNSADGARRVRYRATFETDTASTHKQYRDFLPPDPHWRPSIHMPRWASRLTLEVTAVKVERLQDISEQDAQAEGIAFNFSLDPFGRCQWASAIEHGKGWSSAAAAFEELWISINGAESWASNPWVVAVTFTAHRQNIDAYLAAPPLSHTGRRVGWGRT